MPDATITSTASTFGTISGVFSADQSTITGTVAGSVVGTLDGSVGVPGPQGPTGATGATGPQGPAGAGLPSGGTEGQIIIKASATDYDTVWADNSGVAWGAITGTLSAQTDLQTAMDAKLDISTAASTYYLQTNPAGYITSSALSGYATESWVSGQDYATNSAVASTYQTLSGMSSYATLGGCTFTGQIVTKASNGASAGLKIPLGTDPSAPVDGEIWNGGSALKARLASVTETIANQSWVTTELGSYLTTATAASTYQTQAGMSSYLTTASAASTYAPIASPTFTGTVTIPAGASISGFAPLASPALTGTPTAPTATAGTNTTQIATTAFVTTAVPAFATETQAIYGTSSTTALSPLLVRHILANPMLTTYNSLVGNYSSFVSGSGSVSTVWSNLFAVKITAANGKAAFQPNSQVSYHSIQSRGKAELTVDWTKPMWFSFRFCYSSSGTIGDSNTVNRVTIGKVSSTFGDLTSAGIGVKWTAGTSGAFTVMAHNGTTQTTSASSVTVSNTTYFPTTSSAADFLVYSDGAGNVTLYCNNVQVATTTGGPSSGTSPGPRFVFESDNTTSTSGTVTCDYTGVKSMLAY